MRPLIRSLIAAAAIGSTGGVSATNYWLNFTATDFVSNNGTFAPQETVHGTLLLDINDAHGWVDAVHHVDLEIAGHAYKVEEIAIDVRYPNSVLFGAEHASARLTPGTNDFWFIANMDRNAAKFAYMTPQSPTSMFDAKSITYAFTPAVPEPSAIVLAMAGLSLVGLKARRSAARPDR